MLAKELNKVMNDALNEELNEAEKNAFEFFKAECLRAAESGNTSVTIFSYLMNGKIDKKLKDEGIYFYNESSQETRTFYGWSNDHLSLAQNQNPEPNVPN